MQLYNARKVLIGTEDSSGPKDFCVSFVQYHQSVLIGIIFHDMMLNYPQAYNMVVYWDRRFILLFSLEILIQLNLISIWVLTQFITTCNLTKIHCYLPTDMEGTVLIVQLRKLPQGNTILTIFPVCYFCSIYFHNPVQKYTIVELLIFTTPRHIENES